MTESIVIFKLRASSLAFMCRKCQNSPKCDSRTLYDYIRDFYPIYAKELCFELKARYSIIFCLKIMYVSLIKCQIYSKRNETIWNRISFIHNDLERFFFYIYVTINWIKKLIKSVLKKSKTCMERIIKTKILEFYYLRFNFMIV